MSSFHNNHMSHLQQQQHEWASEAVPLNQQQGQQHYSQQQESYSTFQQWRYTETGSKRSRPWHLFPVTVVEKDRKRIHVVRQDNIISTKSLLMFVLVLLVGLYMGHSSNKTRQQQQQQQQQQNEIMTLPHHTGTWIWDYNVYHNINNSSSATATATTTDTTAVQSNNNNLLLTQIAGSRSLQELSDISSLPNRAYARQWRRDYVQIVYTSAGGATADRNKKSLLEKSCFTKVFVLQWLLEKQQQQQQHNNNNRSNHDTTASTGTVVVGEDTVNSSSSSRNNGDKATTTTTIPYDTVALLPPDAIVTDLDYDLEQLLPPDKLVAIAGYYWREAATNHHHDNDDDDGEQMLAAAAAMTDIVFFNLRHKHAAEVIQLWYDDAVNPEHHVTCGAGNDLQLLFQVMRSVVQNDEDKFQSMIHGLIQTEQGFIIGGKDQDSNYNNNRVIKSITPAVPACRLSLMLADMANSRAVLQTTADSVCYRYYPKCELL